MPVKPVPAAVAGLLAGLVVGGAAGIALGGGRGAASGADGEAADLLASMAARQDERLGRLTREADESARLQRELALALFYRLQEFRRFGLEGQIVTWIVPGASAGSGDPLGGSLAGAVRLPQLAADAATRAEWRAVSERLASIGAEVDPTVFSAFEDVLEFVEGRPWPEGSGLAAAAVSGWADPATVEAWLSLNRALVGRADAILSGF
ncbi:MAG: hypothetical protein OXI39_15855 [Gemmatimonadota bacterium]|uniref:hypothetical protein n=1 Tax=Candidatus Palauibacter scopulicola TaxID=3056741 RepID=UPI002395452A|nr:hypothetical protein [Candidatus Palauibacter scopulicola]MDE2664463.1 hypothetical protein [Candidatus Palauibacter scopulicola]